MSQAILEALKDGPKPQGELKDLTGLPYRKLQKELANLIGAGQVCCKFADSPSPYLLYSLVQEPKPSGFFRMFQH